MKMRLHEKISTYGMRRLPSGMRVARTKSPSIWMPRISVAMSHGTWWGVGRSGSGSG